VSCGDKLVGERQRRRIVSQTIGSECLVAINRLVVLVGGVGGVKLVHGLTHLLAPEQLTVIVNTGDDFSHYGLRVSPDLDTIMYTLSGLVNRENGWGVADDTTHMLEAMQRYGEDMWFRLGDRDMATHLLRTHWLREGLTLTEVTQRLTKSVGINHQILPMTDAPVATIIDTVEYGELEFQVYFVRHRWQPTARAIHYVGADSAGLSAEAQAALAKADAIIISPSNPWLSIAPILAVPGMRAAIEGRNVPRIAISPIIQGQAVKGPTAKLMTELGYELSAVAVAKYYASIINGFVYDVRDEGLQFPTGNAAMMDTLMQSEADRVRLAQNVLSWIESWGQ
jgi:LPPG:FO 2-phospho-L-lactate transferase